VRVLEEDGLAVAAILKLEVRFLSLLWLLSSMGFLGTYSSGCSPARFTSFQHHDIGFGCPVRGVAISLQEMAGNAGSCDATSDNDNIGCGGQVPR
jgi:hypothetical protein